MARLLKTMSDQRALTSIGIGRVYGLMDNTEYATSADVVAAINRLTDEEHAKLMVVAGFWFKRHEARLRPVLEPRDLLSEAFEATLSGERHWRRSKVTFLKHMDQAM